MAPLALNVLLKPDQVMRQAAERANKFLLQDYPQGFAFDDTHHIHLTCLQCFVKDSDLKQFRLLVETLAMRFPMAGLTLKATGYHWHHASEKSVGSIEVEKNEILTAFHREMVKESAQYVAKFGDRTAFARFAGESEIKQDTIDYVENFRRKHSLSNYKPHVTVGLANANYLEKIAEGAFSPFTFSSEGVGLYQIGNHGTARLEV